MRAVHTAVRQQGALTVEVAWTKATLKQRTQAILKRAGDMVVDLLLSVEVRSGHFGLRYMRQRSFRAAQRIAICEVSRQTIRICVRPGDNRSAFEYELLVPRDSDAQLLHGLLISKVKGAPEDVLVDTAAPQLELLDDDVATVPDDPTLQPASPEPSPPPLDGTTSSLMTMMQSFAAIQQAAERTKHRDDQRASLQLQREPTKTALDALRAKRVAILEELHQQEQTLLAELTTFDDELLAIDSADEADVQGREAVTLLNSLQKFLQK